MRWRPRLICTIPSFHNPTGVTTDQAHRERLLALSEDHRVPLVEDGFEEEMKYFGRAVLPIKSMDRPLDERLAAPARCRPTPAKTG